MLEGGTMIMLVSCIAIALVAVAIVVLGDIDNELLRAVAASAVFCGVLSATMIAIAVLDAAF